MSNRLRDLAKEARAYFTTRVRDGEEIWVTTKNNVPVWVVELVAAAHDNRNILPDDYRYEFVVRALDALCDMADDSDPEDLPYDMLEADTYTHQLTRWLHSAPNRVYYLSEILSEYEVKDGFQLLTLAQEREIHEVFWSVLESLRKRLEELDGDNELINLGYATRVHLWHGEDGWYFTVYDVTPYPQPHGPYPDKQAALDDAERKLGRAE